MLDSYWKIRLMIIFWNAIFFSIIKLYKCSKNNIVNSCSHYLLYFLQNLCPCKKRNREIYCSKDDTVSIFSHRNSWHHQKDLRPHWLTRVTAYANRSADQLNAVVGLYRLSWKKNRLIDRSSKSASHLETLNCLLDETLQSKIRFPFFFTQLLQIFSTYLVETYFILFQYLNVRKGW